MAETYLFPFESINKGSKILLFGAGKVGKSYLEQLIKTNYCEVISIIDNKMAGKYINSYFIETPVKGLAKQEYDYIVLATTIQKFALEMKEYLIKQGIQENKIIFDINRLVGRWKDQEVLNKKVVNKVVEKKEVKEKPIKEENILYLGFINKGGIGDTLMDLAFVKEIRKMIPYQICIDYYCRCYKLFLNRVPFFDNVHSSEEKIEYEKYDLLMSNHRYWMVDILNAEKVKHFSVQLYDLCMESEHIVNDIFNGSKTANANLITQLGELKLKNRIEQANMSDIINFNRNTQFYLGLYADDFKLFYKLKLNEKKYITISRSADALYEGTHTKLWPLEYYNALIPMIKSAYPDILVIQVGSDERFGIMENTDINLVGKTSITEVSAILKHSIIHIDGEGGLVHMKYCLNGLSIVLFGPTIPKIYGYDKNINIKKNICENGCTWISGEWMKKCIIGHTYPKCMYSISPKEVFQKLFKYINDIKIDTYEIIEIIDDDETLIENILLKKHIIDMCEQIQVGIIGQGKENIVEGIRKTNIIPYILDDFTVTLKNKTYLEYFEWAKVNNVNIEYSSRYNISARDEQFQVVIDSELEMSDDICLAFSENCRITQQNGIICCYLDRIIIMELIEKSNAIVLKSILDNLDFSDKKWIIIRKQ